MRERQRDRSRDTHRDRDSMRMCVEERRSEMESDFAGLQYLP